MRDIKKTCYHCANLMHVDNTPNCKVLGEETNALSPRCLEIQAKLSEVSQDAEYQKACRMAVEARVSELDKLRRHCECMVNPSMSPLRYEIWEEKFIAIMASLKEGEG